MLRDEGTKSPEGEEGVVSVGHREDGVSWYGSCAISRGYNLINWLAVSEEVVNLEKYLKLF